MPFFDIYKTGQLNFTFDFDTCVFLETLDCPLGDFTVLFAGYAGESFLFTDYNSRFW
jgi:hypothetical protein